MDNDNNKLIDFQNTKWLIKHTSFEFGKQWWFLYEFNYWPSILEVEKLNTKELKKIRAIRFLKRFESEEEFDLEVTIKYGTNFEMLEK